MFTSNPFSLITEYLPAFVMQVYVVLMLFAVAAGTLFDLHHKQSARYFSLRRKRAQAAARRRLGTAEVASLALRTLATEVATSGEFCKWQRRLSHLLTAYGFVIYLVTTVVMVFVYSTAAQTPLVLTALWNIGVLMILAGGGWFFFFLRADVAHEGRSPFHLMQADLFIGSLLASTVCGLAWHFAQSLPAPALVVLTLFGLYLFFTTLLFASVPWSKFAHMFYKPMAAFQKRLEEANGASDLPRPAPRSHIGG